MSRLLSRFSPGIIAQRACRVLPLRASPSFNGRNGGGDRYFTDGELAVGVLVPGGAEGTRPVQILASPTPVVWKNQFWSWFAPAVAVAGR